MYTAPSCNAAALAGAAGRSRCSNWTAGTRLFGLHQLMQSQPLGCSVPCGELMEEPATDGCKGKGNNCPLTNSSVCPRYHSQLRASRCTGQELCLPASAAATDHIWPQGLLLCCGRVQGSIAQREGTEPTISSNSCLCCHASA
jgi:hypothetical protein